jgi:hypothetical protein
VNVCVYVCARACSFVCLCVHVCMCVWRQLCVFMCVYFHVCLSCGIPYLCLMPSVWLCACACARARTSVPDRERVREALCAQSLTYEAGLKNEPLNVEQD